MTKIPLSRYARRKLYLKGSLMLCKRFFFLVLSIMGLSCYGFSQEDVEEKKPSLSEINIDDISETLGHLIFRHLQNPGFEFNVDKVIEGVQAEKAGQPAPMSEEQYEQTLVMIQEALFQKTAEANLKEANSFLEKNLIEQDMIVLDPKLHYKIEAAGEGEIVTEDSVPLIHYTGKLLNGTVFASSREAANPIALPIKQTIPGFTKGLVGMKEGEKRTLYIHPDMAYGVAGHLPPNSLLIFEVEVLKSNAPQASEEIQGVTEDVKEEVSPS